jgi:hypothetical protein
MPRGGNNQVIQQIDAQYFTRIYKLPRNLQVSVTRYKAARRVVVGNNDSYCIVLKCRLKDFPRVYDARRETANGNDLVMYYLVLGSEI